jgi:hypothetical protein
VNLKIIPMLALLAVPALAQVTAATPWQVGVAGNWSRARTTNIANPGGAGSVTVNQNAGIGVAVLAGYSFLQMEQSDLSVTAEYQAPTSFPVKSTTSIPGEQGGSSTTRMSSGAVGVQLNLHGSFDIGGGFQCKWERLSNNDFDVTTTYTRPWATACGGASFDVGSPVVKPFVNLRASMAMARSTPADPAGLLAGDPSSLKRFLRSSDANYQISLAAGVRF